MQIEFNERVQYLAQINTEIFIIIWTLSKGCTACILTRMRPAPALLIAIMCLSLLILQMSGLHLHVSADSQSGALHGTHIHDMDFDGHGHDHNADVDISPFEPGTPSSKLILFLVTLVFALLAVIWASRIVWPPLAEHLSTRCRSRWRPPLRAPPQHSL